MKNNLVKKLLGSSSELEQQKTIDFVIDRLENSIFQDMVNTTWNRMIFDDENYFNVSVTYDDTNEDFKFRLTNLASDPNLRISPEEFQSKFVKKVQADLDDRITIDPDSSMINIGFNNSDGITKAQLALRVELSKDNDDGKDE